MAVGAPPEDVYVFVAGTRPEAVKLAPVILALEAQGRSAILVATGQHRHLLSETLTGLGLAADIDLDVMRDGQSPADVVAALLPPLMATFARLRPAVVVQGDTTSAFAGAVAANYAGCRLAHVEAGLRSGKRDPFPEEFHRRSIAAMADVHFASTRTAMAALALEGVPAGNMHLTGNTGIDALCVTRNQLARDTGAQARLALRFADIDRQRPLIIATVHRRENHGAPLTAILAALADLASVAGVVLPVHPSPAVAGRVWARLGGLAGVHLLPPLDYPAFIWLLQQATLVLTNSGGIQEEAPALGVPVLVLRDVTERPEGVVSGNARLIGTRRGAIVGAVAALLGDAAAMGRMAEPAMPYGAGDAAARIAALLVGRFGTKGLHHGGEARETRGDGAGIVNGHGCAGVEAQDGEAHGDAMIQLRSDRGAAGQGIAA